jgi:hypothetical protein
VTLLQRLEFLGRVLDQDPQVTQELPHIVCAVLGFNELDTLFDGGTGAGKIHDRLHLGVCQPAGIQGARRDEGLNLLAPRRVDGGLAAGIFKPTPRLGVRNVAITPPDLSTSVS